MKGSISELEHQSSPGLRRQDEIGELSRQFSKLIDNVARQNRELDDLSRRDPLTGLLNRRSLTEKLQLLRKEHPEKMLCGLYIDIDHFKAYNDTYGHIYGDNALVLVSGELDAFAREKSGFAFRLGGEEFMLVLTADNEDQGFNHAQDLCERVEEMGIPHSGGTDSKCITVSIGLACTKEEKIVEEVTQNVLVRADKALYSAKELGRNLVQMYSTKYQDPAN
ncbi:GGDEF domain-containing protein [Veronia nyctiphanis]|nr:GGDEF domain-containing protein [Veronia nyctiphanis]